MTAQRSAFSYFLPLFGIGALHAISFAPDPLPLHFLPFVQLITLACLAFYSFKAARASQFVWGAFGFGLANFGVGIYWLHISMHQYGGMPFLLAAMAVALFAGLMALYYVVAIALARFFIPNARGAWQQQLAAAAIWASAWTLLEWVRGTFLTGFPWLNIAYAHVDSMFTGWATVLGAYGVAWWVAFTAAVMALFALNTHKHAPKSYSFPLGLALLGALAGILLGGIQWHQPHGDPFYVRLAQGNIDQQMKFDPAHLQDGVKLYKQLAAAAPKDPEASPALIILPETIIPLFQHQWQLDFWQEWIDIAKQQQATILLGAPLYAQQGERGIYTNSVISIDENSSPTAIQQLQLDYRYDKHHLVPFGEFIPPGFHWFLELLHIPLGDFNRGATRQANLSLHQQYIGPDICYEDVFGEEIIQSVRPHADHGNGATMLINISNLAWFGDTWALRQHLQIARMRSIETARPMLRATNTGATAAIFPTGEVQALLPTHTVGILDVEVQGTQGLTPYVQLGNWPIVTWSLIVLLLLGRKLRATHPHSQHNN
ncbi:apolipoprotein N-acyltransferase [Paenalcaligenes hermetiae]|uniref:Apolipoprotein N-acyltransferase n=1 Tax=Paenalcaligenes hermetiae TaxID=1157987 RepID=A0ABP9M102_9BURK